MNERQRKFADYYIELDNATEAAIKAGYSKKYAGQNADKLLKNTKISKYIKERYKEHQENRVASQHDILMFLTDVINGKATGKDKIGLGQGAEKLIDREPNLQERIRAAEQLGKRYGMWTDKHEIEHKLPTFVDDVNE